MGQASGLLYLNKEGHELQSCQINLITHYFEDRGTATWSGKEATELMERSYPSSGYFQVRPPKQQPETSHIVPMDTRASRAFSQPLVPRSEQQLQSFQSIDAKHNRAFSQPPEVIKRNKRQCKKREKRPVAQKDEEEHTGWAFLPHELLFMIFSSLSDRDMRGVALTCVSWNAVSRDRRLQLLIL